MSLLSKLTNAFASAISASKGRAVIAVGWRSLRDRHLKAHPYCEICGYLPGPKGTPNDAHHIIPRHVDESKILDDANLITLCRKYDCHLRFGHFGDYRRYYNVGIRNLFQGSGERMQIEEIKAKQGGKQALVEPVSDSPIASKKIYRCGSEVTSDGGLVTQTLVAGDLRYVGFVESESDDEVVYVLRNGGKMIVKKVTFF